jgi:hypothetical protein
MLSFEGICILNSVDVKNNQSGNKSPYFPSCKRRGSLELEGQNERFPN